MQRAGRRALRRRIEERFEEVKGETEGGGHSRGESRVVGETAAEGEALTTPRGGGRAEKLRPLLRAPVRRVASSPGRSSTWG